MLESIREADQGLADINAKLADYASRLAPLRRLLIDVVSEIALPLFARALPAETICREAERTVAEFEQFVATIGRTVKARRAAATIPAPARRDETSVATPPRLRIVYDRTIDGQRMPTLADHVMALEGSVRGRQSYRNCGDLADHFERGTGALLDRMEDFVRGLFLHARSLGVLDMLETQGVDAARAELAMAAAESASAVDFSPTLLASFSPPGTTASYVVWTEGGRQSRIATDYRGVLGIDPQFLDSRDRCLVEILSLCLGFPAYAVHMLEECRELATAAAPLGDRDIWPKRAG
jgi:hypothetical protein